jgi:hypothetical protein
VGFGGRLKADEEQGRKEAKLERHKPLVSLERDWKCSKRIPGDLLNAATPVQ